MKEIILKYWFQLLLTGVTGYFLALVKKYFKKIKKGDEEQMDIKFAILSILHDKIYREATFLLKKGKIKVSELNNLEYLYKGYAKLGGNGTCKVLYERVCQLPLIDDTEVHN